MADYYRGRDLPACYLHIFKLVLFSNGQSCCCYGGPSDCCSLAQLWSADSKELIQTCAEYGLVQAQSFHENWEVFEVSYTAQQIFMLWLLTRLFPRNGIGSEYQRSIIEDLRPFQRGSFNLNAFISKPARGLLSLVRDKHVQDGELKVNLIHWMSCNIAFLSCSLPPLM